MVPKEMIVYICYVKFINLFLKKLREDLASYGPLPSQQWGSMCAGEIITVPETVIADSNSY